MGILESVKGRSKVQRKKRWLTRSQLLSLPKLQHCLELERSEASRFSNPSVAGPSIHVGLGSPITEEASSYPSPVLQRSQSFENPLDGCGSQNFNTQYEEQFSTEDPVYGIALYDFFAGEDHNELNLTAGEEFEIEYEVDGWFYVKKKCPGRDGKMAGLVPVLYVSQFEFINPT